MRESRGVLKKFQNFGPQIENWKIFIVFGRTTGKVLYIRKLDHSIVSIVAFARTGVCRVKL